MFDRIKYKSFSKTQLKKRFKIPILMLLVSTAIVCFIIIPTEIRNSAIEVEKNKNFFSYDFFISSVSNSFVQNLVEFFVSILVFVLFVASLNVYLKMSKSPEKVFFSDFIEGFESWARAILAGLWQSLWIYLWSLLFFIPGIVKSYAYSQHFYLISEYKNLSIMDALKISMKITNGHKWDLFVLDLSFVGWFLFGIITCGLGFLYVLPYYQMTKINAYHGLLKEAVERGIVTQEDLNA